MKTNKSFSKRLRITKKGKVLKRKSGQNHFNAKESRASQLNKKRSESFNIKKKALSHFLPYN
ncbi:MAG: 50S ribosomal protein L35 [Patescibacteria group bacterium]